MIKYLPSLVRVLLSSTSLFIILLYTASNFDETEILSVAIFASICIFIEGVVKASYHIVKYQTISSCSCSENNDIRKKSQTCITCFQSIITVYLWYSLA